MLNPFTIHLISIFGIFVDYFFQVTTFLNKSCKNNQFLFHGFIMPFCTKIIPEFSSS